MTDEKSDVDQYQDELSEQVEDGGGCAEMWSALSTRREKNNLSRRSLLRRAGGTTAGLALASTLQATLASTAVASEEKAEKVLETVETSNAFREVRERVFNSLSSGKGRLQVRPGKLFSSKKVQEVVVENITYPISTHSTSFGSGRTETTVEISSLVENGAVSQVRGLVKQAKKSETTYISVVHNGSELDEKSVQLNEYDLYQNGQVTKQQAQCIPCDSQFCYDSCVAVWDVICYNEIGDELCSDAYTTASACIVIGLFTGKIGSALCALFLAAVCEGDISCYDTPENMCRDSSSACDDPWLN
jgi:hypothetical protein